MNLKVVPVKQESGEVIAFSIEGPNSEYIADVHINVEGSPTEAEAEKTADLFAAAPEMLDALNLAKAGLAHDAPGSCWATGPMTGDPIEDLVVCPGCRALKAIDTVIAKVENRDAIAKAEGKD